MTKQLDKPGSIRRRAGYAIGAGALTVGAIGGVFVAAASAGAATPGSAPVAGTCSANSVVTMTVTNSDPGRLEASFEVDKAPAGSVWAVTLRHNGAVYFQHNRTAIARSFSVDRVVTDATGVDHFAGRAVNAASGEVCSVRVSH